MENQNQQPAPERVTGKIESVNSIKTGESSKNGRTFNWTLFEVVISGQKYRTFDQGYQQLIGQTKEWQFKKESRQGRNGQWYENRTLLNLSKPSAVGVIQEEFKEVHEKLDKIMSLLETDQRTDIPTDSPEDYEPEPEDIPDPDGF